MTAGHHLGNVIWQEELGKVPKRGVIYIVTSYDFVNLESILDTDIT